MVTASYENETLSGEIHDRR